MNNYNIGDYGDFETGLASIKSLNDNLDTSKNKIADLKAKLNSDAIFMGPICDNCLENFTNVDKGIDILTENFSKLGNYLIDTATAYKDGDEKAKNMVAIAQRRLEKMDSYVKDSVVAYNTAKKNREDLEKSF